MKPFGIVLASVLFFSPFTFAAAPATQPSLEKENAALKARVAELEAKVAQLQLQVQQLRAVPPSVRGNLMTPGPLQFNFKDGRYEVLPQPQATPPSSYTQGQLAAPIIPPNAVPQQFNGQPFYVIPLSESVQQQLGVKFPPPVTPTGTGAIIAVPQKGSLDSSKK